MTKTWKLTGAAAVTAFLLMAGPVTVVAGSETAPQRVWNTVTSFVVTEAHAAAPGTGELANAVHGEHGAEGDHGGGFPPFNPTHFASQLFWLALTFAALYFLMSRVTLPRIGRILEERHDRIADDLEEAAKHKADSEAAQAAYEKALAEARAKANSIAGETRNRLSAEQDTNRKSLEADLASKLASAEERIASTKTEALTHVKGIAVDATGAIVSTLIGTSPAQHEVEQAVDGALAKKDAA